MHIPHTVHLPSNSSAPSNDSVSRDAPIKEAVDSDINREDPSSSSHNALILDSADVDINCNEIDSISHATSWTDKLIYRYSDSSFHKPIRSPCNQMLNWTWINEALWPNGMFPDDPIADMVRCTAEDLASSLFTAFELGNTNAISIEEENHLLSLTNPSRISPKIPLQLPGAIAAICEELNMLLLPGVNKIPGLIVACNKKDEYKKLPRIHSTMVVKRKSTLKFKARRCARGDMLSADAPLNYSSPTATRVSPRMILAIHVSFSFSIGIVDIASAFIQSNMVEKDKRLITISPYYIPFPLTNKVDTSLPRIRNPPSHY